MTGVFSERPGGPGAGELTTTQQCHSHQKSGGARRTEKARPRVELADRTERLSKGLTSHPTLNRSFRGCSFQPVSWLVAGNRKSHRRSAKSGSPATSRPCVAAQSYNCFRLSGMSGSAASRMTSSSRKTKRKRCRCESTLPTSRHRKSAELQTVRRKFPDRTTIVICAPRKHHPISPR